MPSERRPLFVDPKHITDRWFPGCVRVDVRRRRSTIHNAKYWAELAEVVASGATPHPTSEHLHVAIKMELGYVEPVIRLDGTIEFRPDSTNFESMDQSDFNVFYMKAVDLIQTYYGIDMSKIARAA